MSGLSPSTQDHYESRAIWSHSLSRSHSSHTRAIKVPSSRIGLSGSANSLCRLEDVMSKKVWLITGAGRGMGVDFARAALASGHSVVASGRDRDRVSKVLGASS